MKANYNVILSSTKQKNKIFIYFTFCKGQFLPKVYLENPSYAFQRYTFGKKYTGTFKGILFDLHRTVNQKYTFEILKSIVYLWQKVYHTYIWYTCFCFHPMLFQSILFSKSILFKKYTFFEHRMRLSLTAKQTVFPANFPLRRCMLFQTPVSSNSSLFKLEFFGEHY